MEWFIDHYMSASDKRDLRASPLLASSLENLPPAYVITAGFDPLRDEGFAYARRLREADNTVEYVEYGGMVHGFIGMGGVLATANRAIAAAGAALRQALSD
jgi:acetyl esterase